MGGELGCRKEQREGSDEAPGEGDAGHKEILRSREWRGGPKFRGKLDDTGAGRDLPGEPTLPLTMMPMRFPRPVRSRSSRLVAFAGAAIASVAIARAAAAQAPMDSALAAFIMSVKAIDHHAHPLLPPAAR